MKFLATLAALAAVASAIQITEPKQDAKLDFSATNTIKWTSVESDPEEFKIELINQSAVPETSTVLAAKVKRDDKEYKFENVVATPGTKYRVKFFAIDSKQNTGQLAESQTFAVTKSGVKPSTTPAPSAAPTNTDAASAQSSSSSKAGAMGTAVGLAGPVAAFLAFLA